MADQTVRTIYQAQVAGAVQGLNQLGKATSKAADDADDLADALEKAGGTKVSPEIDLSIEDAEKEVQQLKKMLDDLESQPSALALEVDIAKSEAKIEALERELQILGAMESTPKVEADTVKAQAQLEGLQNRIKSMESLKVGMVATADVDQARADLEEAEAHLEALQGAKAEMVVTADTGDAVGDLAKIDSEADALNGKDVEIPVTVDGDSVDDAFDDMGDSAEDAGGEAGKMAGNALMDGLNSTPIVGAVVGILGAAGIAGAAAFWAGFQSEKISDTFGARTGLDEATTRKYGVAAGRSYAEGWGDSIQDNFDSAEIARMNDLIFDTDTTSRISDVNSMLQATSELLGSDLPETAEAAGTMIKNGLAKDAEDAFNIIVLGYQQGLDRSGDYLDTLREYSPLFASLGLSGEEALGLISQSMDAGARSSDLAADAIKEFSIRAQDDSKTTRQAFTDLGLDADKMGAKIAAGGDDAKEGLGLVLDGLRAIEDPMERNRIGTELFGTQWEDLGNGAQVLAMDLDDLGGAWTQSGDTAETAMQRMSDNAASQLESAKRTVIGALTEFGGGMAAVFSDDLVDFSQWVSTNRGTILGFLQEVGNGFFDVARAAVEFGAQTIEVGGMISGVLANIVGGIGDTLVAFGTLTGDTQMIELGNELKGAGDAMETFSQNSDEAADSLRDNMNGALDEAQDKFNGFMDPAVAQANIDDAIAVITSRLDEFGSWVDENDLELTINGNTVDAETALNELITAIDEGQGYVIINGDLVPAEEAYDKYIAELEENGGTVTIDANTEPALIAITALQVANQTIEVAVEADTEPAEEEVGIFAGQTAETSATVKIDADTLYGEEELRAFQSAVNESGGTVTINGETMTGQEALDTLEAEINAGGGTVNINGTPVDAETALLQLTDMINGSGGTVTIDGDPAPANSATDGAVSHADGSTGTIDVDANTSGAESDINTTARDRDTDIDAHANDGGAESDLNHTSRDRSSSINAHANDGSAERDLNHTARNRTSTIFASIRVSGSAQISGRAFGGMVQPGLAAGGNVGAGYGIVPGPRAAAGVDNVLWPLARGGQVLSQPLAGGEFVVNPVSTAIWQPFLEAINGGARPTDLAVAPSGPSSLSLDGAALSQIAAAVRAGASQASISVGTRDASSIVRAGQRGMGR